MHYLLYTEKDNHLFLQALGTPQKALQGSSGGHQIDPQMKPSFYQGEQLVVRSAPW